MGDRVPICNCHGCRVEKPRLEARIVELELAAVVALAALGPDGFAPTAIDVNGREYAYDLKPAREQLRKVLDG